MRVEAARAALLLVQSERRLNGPSKFGRTRPFKLLKWGLQLAILAAVGYGIWRTIAQSLDKFAENQFSLGSLHPGWLAACGMLYLAGSLPPCWFWRKAMQAMGQRPPWYASIRAFYIGHLGKYLPGKAAVVLLRAGLVRGPQVDTTVAATAVFVETLTTMAVGAVLAAAILGMLYHEQRQLLLAAIGMAALAGVPALPPVFRKVVRLLRVTRASASLDAGLDGLRWPLMIGGWFVLGASWFVLGLSLWAALKALPEPPPGLDDLTRSLPLLTLCCAFALVAGFVSMLPAGAGVREAVVLAVLVPAYGEVAAIVAAVLLRLVWLLAEVVVSIILYAIRPRSAPRNDAPAPEPAA